LLDQRRDCIQGSLHDVFGELDVSCRDVDVRGLLDLVLKVFVVDDSVAHVTALVGVAICEADFPVGNVELLFGEGRDMARGRG
jgi:hypothetical protein